LRGGRRKFRNHDVDDLIGGSVIRQWEEELEQEQEQEQGDKRRTPGRTALLGVVVSEHQTFLISAMPGICIGADFAILRNSMADNRLNSPDRQTMVTLTDYRSCPVLTAREVTDGKSGCPF
jgi:hypothetical protein